MNTLLYTLVGCNFVAAAVRTALAAGHMRLYQSSFTPNINSPSADFITAEADYTGYAAGGIAVATWLAPILDPLGGYSIGSPVVQFTTDPAIVDTNIIGGFFYTDAADEVVIFGQFSDPVPMQVPGQGIPLNPRLVFPPG